MINLKPPPMPTFPHTTVAAAMAQLKPPPFQSLAASTISVTNLKPPPSQSATAISMLTKPPVFVAGMPVVFGTSMLKAPPSPAAPTQDIPHKQATAQELWDAGRPSAYGGLDNDKYEKTKNLNKKMSLEDFLKIHF